MTPDQIDELIAMVEAGEEGRIQYPNGLTVTLTRAHLDDLHLARALSARLVEYSAKLDGWLRRTYG